MEEPPVQFSLCAITYLVFPFSVVFRTIRDKLLIACGQGAFLVSVSVFFFLRWSQMLLTHSEFCPVP